MRVEYKRLYEQVIHILKKNVENGEFIIGEKLPSERDLAKDMGVSRGTLRDAFRVLESQGIIETIPGGGRILKKDIQNSLGIGQKFIDQIRKAAILELIEAREIIEVGMVELICKNATDEELLELKSIVERLDNDCAEEQSNDFIFHYSLAKCSKNNVLINFMELNLNIIKEAQVINFSKKQYRNEAQEEHSQILKALINRDVDSAKEAMKNHFINIKKRIGRQVS